MIDVIYYYKGLSESVWKKHYTTSYVGRQELFADKELTIQVGYLNISASDIINDIGITIKDVSCTVVTSKGWFKYDYTKTNDISMTVPTVNVGGIFVPGTVTRGYEPSLPDDTFFTIRKLTYQPF